MSSDSDEENYVRYGTPLEPYEEDEVPSKRRFQEPTDQYAIDAHGKRRFHGAFTGGFSAGYGNTVGTPEGWTPATFKSSRGEKAEVASQRPEDFMDEEDRGEHGIAPRHMQTQNEFSGQKRPRQQRYYDGPIPGEPVLEQLVRAVHETAAVRMLRAMGWKEGQGVGNRVSSKEKREAKERHKVYGCYMPPDMRQNTEHESEDESSGSEFEYEALFAPDDYEPYILNRKNDKFGLGYSGLSRHSILGNLVGEYGESSPKSHLVMKDKGKKVSIRGQAFGVGAFEAEDEDIYTTEDMSHYDFSIGGAANDKPKKKDNKEKGVHVLEGFVKSSKPLPSVPSYPSPALPRDYTPAPAGTRRSRFEPTTHEPRDQGLGRHELTPAARGELLGETPVPKTTDPPEKPIDNDPIAKLLGRNVNFVTDSTKIIDKTKEVPTELDYIPIKDSGKELVKVFKPFVGDPKKQARYERYLKDKDSVFVDSGEVDRLTEWERNREIVEFEQAAKLYRPLTGEMGDRFTHASEPDDGPINPLCAVAKSNTNYGLATPEQIDAAKRGLYGVMTRREVPWRPEPLVYKRFNVPDPGGARPEDKKEDKPKLSYSIFSYLESSVHDKESFAKEQCKFSGSKSLNVDAPKTIEQVGDVNKSNKSSKQIDKVDKNTKSNEKLDIAPSSETASGFNKRLTVAELFMKESEKDMQDKEKSDVTETIEKFDKIDLYRSIFLSDTENEEEIDENDENNTYDFFETPKNVERNTSPPRGIFANIDFDELNSWKRNVDNKQENASKANDTTNKATNSKDIAKPAEVETEAIYGPKIPENLVKRLEANVNEYFKPEFRSKDKRETIDINSSSSDSWVDVKELTSKKKKKKVKKHKSKHKKSKEHKKHKKDKK